MNYQIPIKSLPKIEMSASKAVTKKNTKSQQKKIKEIENVIAKVKNAMANNWAVNKTLKKKRDQVGKQILAQRQKELNHLKKLSKKITFTQESAVRFFEKNAPPTVNATKKNNAKETTAENTKPREGKYVGSKTRTKRVLKNLNDMKKYVEKMASRAAIYKPKIEAQWARKMRQDELEESEKKFLNMLERGWQGK